jgi:hypothetical protein
MRAGRTGRSGRSHIRLFGCASCSRRLKRVGDPQPQLDRAEIDKEADGDRGCVQANKAVREEAIGSGTLN